MNQWSALCEHNAHTHTHTYTHGYVHICTLCVVTLCVAIVCWIQLLRWMIDWEDLPEDVAHTYAHPSTHTCIQKYMYLYIYMHAHVYICTHTQIYMYTYHSIGIFRKTELTGRPWNEFLNLPEKSPGSQKLGPNFIHLQILKNSCSRLNWLVDFTN